MKAFSLVCLTATLFIGSIAASEANSDEEKKNQQQLPGSVVKILNDVDAAVLKNKKVFDDANEKSFSLAEKNLRSEIEKMTKAGKLDEAILIKQAMDTMRNDSIDKSKLTNKHIPAGEILQNKKIFCGPWNWSWSGWNTFTFEKNGHITNWWIPGGKWSYNDKDNTFTVIDNSWAYVVSVETDSELTVVRNDGAKNTMNKKGTN